MARYKKCKICPWLSAKTDCSEKRFIQLGDSLLFSKSYQELGSGAKELYICMAMEAGGKRDFVFTHGTAKKYGIKKSSFDRHKATLIAVKFIEPIFDAEYRQYAPGKYRFIFDWKSETAPQIGVGKETKYPQNGEG